MIILNTSNVHLYLIKNELIAPEDVVAGNYSCSFIPSRNRNYRISCTDQSLIVKQIRQQDVEKVESIQVESHVYKWFGQVDALKHIGHFVPGFKHYDQTSRVLVLEYLDGYKDLDTYYNRYLKFPENTGGEIATILFHLHQDSRHYLTREVAGHYLRNRKPWIFHIAKVDPENYTADSPAGKELIRLIQSQSVFVSHINQLKSEYRFNTLIHGDIKWVNFLVKWDEGGESMKLIDWEMADYGDPLWDIGGFFQSYISKWAFKNTQKDSPESLAELKSMQGIIDDFWHTYSTFQGYSPTEKSANYYLAFRFGAMRMIQTCLEATKGRDKIDVELVRILQLCFNVMDKPVETVNLLMS
ncbi:aminoglycoside phosphotransferase family protein [Roseivirga sp. BDSF3-8]|uniref:aminoglycoside phosphotransferase family protein n=1 Tax=Roseivirga sp. BDSF3-8 TaxID=3241598 RepID=UPI003531E0DF